MKNKLIYFNNVIYALSKDYGFKIDLYRPRETTNFQTGRKTVTREKYRIKKAVMLPNQLFRDYNYAALFGKDIQFGGILDTSQRRVIIDKKYLPRNFDIETNDYIIFNHNRYEIQKIDQMELADYWQLIIKQVVGQPAQEIHERCINSRIDLTDTINEY